MLEEIENIEYLNTSNVTDIGSMFISCRSLTNLDVTGFDTSNVINMQEMFRQCKMLTELNVRGFNTNKVTTMTSMFGGCSRLTELNLSSFNTSQVGYMNSMFNECASLSTIKVSSEWTTSSVVNGKDMFYKCSSLVGGSGTTYNVAHTDYVYARIDGGTENPGYLTSSN